MASIAQPNTDAKLQVYHPIQQTDTMFTTILNNLYNNDEFQKNITRLEGGQDKDKKKAVIIKTTVNKLRVYGSSDKPLLLARDVGILMGISNIRQQVRYYTSQEKVIGLCKQTGDRCIKMEFLTWKGVIRAAGNSRSALSQLFREFIYELVAQVTKDPELLTRVVHNVITNNAELIKEAKIEYDTNAEHYRKLYELEQIRSHKLQLEYENEAQKRIVTETKVIEKDLTIAFKNMEIDRLNERKKKYQEYLDQLCVEQDKTELSLLKHKFLKPLYIYMINDVIYGQLSKKPDYIHFFESVPNYNSLNKYKPFYDEYIYLHLHYGSPLSDEYILAGTEWVLDKKHYDSIITEMNNCCEYITFVRRTTKTLYYTSLDEISDIVSQELVKLIGSSPITNVI